MEAQQSLRTQDCILVFVPYLDNGVSISEQLGCEFFCGGRKTTAQQKGVMYRNWVEGLHQVMVCTNSFGAGNDYADVPLVIHAENPRHAMGYIQESSRAGRNKQPSRCIILPRNSSSPPKCQDIDDHKGEKDMHSILFGSNRTTCITYALTLFNDGVGVDCSSASVKKKCSRCLNPSFPPQPKEMTVILHSHLSHNPLSLLQHKSAAPKPLTVKPPSKENNTTIALKRSHQQAFSSNTSSNPFELSRFKTLKGSQRGLNSKLCCTIQECVKLLSRNLRDLSCHGAKHREIPCSQGPSCHSHHSSTSPTPSYTANCTSTQYASAATSHRSLTGFMLPLIQREILVHSQMH